MNRPLKRSDDDFQLPEACFFVANFTLDRTVTF
jgi:hypothetical protein